MKAWMAGTSPAMTNGKIGHDYRAETFCGFASAVSGSGLSG